MISQRQDARKNKDFARADEIRDELLAMGIQLKDTRNGVEWQEDLKAECFIGGGAFWRNFIP